MTSCEESLQRQITATKSMLAIFVDAERIQPNDFWLGGHFQGLFFEKSYFPYLKE